MKFRLLRADEIDVRVATVHEKGCSLLLYKDARCDMNILDETVGADNWQRRHYDCKGNLFCSVGILNEKEWIWKDDCGAESFTEKEKGEASDSFKRACVNWGIGRELYTAPFIWVPANKNGEELLSIVKDAKTNKLKMKDTFFVEKIAYDELGRISGLCVAKKTAGKSVRVFIWQSEQSKAKSS